MEGITSLLWKILDIINEMSPFLLLGFLLAGLMHTFIPATLYSKYLSRGNFRSVVYSTLLGVPLPLCSCGVIPTAMSLRREGASKGATISFLIATPQTGVDSIFATYSLMGLPFAIIRPIAAIFTALFGVHIVNIANKTDKCNGACESSYSKQTDIAKVQSISCVKEKLSFVSRLKEAVNYAFVEMMQDIGKWLVVGLIVAGLIAVLVPDSFFAVFKGNTMLSMLLVLCVAIPMYICATGSIPIAVALMMKGLTPGAALVMLMAGPACNVASILVINKVLGRKTLIAYLLSIILGSIAFGVVIDTFLPASWFVPSMLSADCCHGEELSWFNLGCTILLALLLINALIHNHNHSHNHDCQASLIEDDEQSAARLRFVIKGLNCTHCRANALEALKSIPGTQTADIDLATGNSYLIGDVTIEQVREAIESLGFEVVS